MLVKVGDGAAVFQTTAPAQDHCARLERLQSARNGSESRSERWSKIGKCIAALQEVLNNRPELIGDDRLRLERRNDCRHFDARPAKAPSRSIRISGPEAIAIADRIFRGKQKPSEFPSHVSILGEIVERRAA